MTRTTALRLGAVLLVLLVGFWAWRHLHYEDSSVDLPLTGEAANNPYYALEHFMRALGVQVERVTTLQAPLTHGVLMTQGHSRDAYGREIDALEPWVRAGGHLVVANTNAWQKSFQRWTGITPGKPMPPPVPAASAVPPAPTGRPDPGVPCRPVTGHEVPSAVTQSAQTQSLCNGLSVVLASRQPPLWRLSSERGDIALSVRIGSGWVTALPGSNLYLNRDLTRGDNAQIVQGALGVKRGDIVYLYVSADAEGLLHRLWRVAAPGLVLLIIAVVLLIARLLPRFGTPVPDPPPLRRSLADQIRATAAFAWRTRQLQALRRAVTRALDDSVGRQIAAYRLLDSRRRAERLAAAACMDADVLRAALTEDATAGAEVQCQAIITLQTARRRLRQRSSNRGLP